LLAGLADYTVDERGDVGSWVRMACVKGLTAYVLSSFRYARSVSSLEERLPVNLYHASIAGILKQGVERLDNVRQLAGQSFMQILDAEPADGIGQDKWRAARLDLLRLLFPRYAL
jgi:hypothetical protein